MRLMLIALLCAAMPSGCHSADTGPPPPEIPKTAPDWTVIKKKVRLGENEKEVTVLEITDNTQPEVTKDDRLRHFHHMHLAFRGFAAVGWNRPYGFGDMKPLEGPAKNVWYVLIGPGDIAADGILRVDLWPRERYAALVELSAEPSEGLKDWSRPPVQLVKLLNPNRKPTSTAEYRVGERKFLVMVNP
jgi:hypothetical protein